MAWRQGRSYSADLRARVLAAVDGGTPARQVAELFQVSISYVYKALIRRRRTGETEASNRRGRPPRKLSVDQEAALVAHVRADKDITLAALQSWLTETHGVRLSVTALWLILDRAGLTFKKNPARRRAGQARRRRAAQDLAGSPALHRP